MDYTHTRNGVYTHSQCIIHTLASDLNPPQNVIIQRLCEYLDQPESASYRGQLDIDVKVLSVILLEGFVRLELPDSVYFGHSDGEEQDVGYRD